MPKKEPTLAEQIERDALDEGLTVAAALRKCIALGAQAGSQDLRDGAGRELHGYADDSQVEVPAYRTIDAPIVIDGVSGGRQFERMQISVVELPEESWSLRDALVAPGCG